MHQMILRRPLYAMAKPPRDVQTQIMALSRTSSARSPALLHMTLLAFVDLADVPSAYVPALLSALTGFKADAFELVFDTIIERRAVTLQASNRSPAARAFQRNLVDFLRKADFPYFGDAPLPHLTISYRPDGQGDQRIDPITWRVEEILFIESIHGKARHEPRGRLLLRKPML